MDEENEMYGDIISQRHFKGWLKKTNIVLCHSFYSSYKYQGEY